jgi:hypothetical protein
VGPAPWRKRKLDRPFLSANAAPNGSHCRFIHDRCCLWRLLPALAGHPDSIDHPPATSVSAVLFDKEAGEGIAMLRKLVIVTSGLMLVVNIDYSAHAQMTIDLSKNYMRANL